jgi:hypothetical protein
VATLKEVAARHDASPARTALSWVLGRPAVSNVIVAARSVRSGHSVSEVDGPATRHRGGPAFESSVSRAVCRWRCLEGSPPDPLVLERRLPTGPARDRPSAPQPTVYTLTVSSIVLAESRPQGMLLRTNLYMPYERNE